MKQIIIYIAVICISTTVVFSQESPEKKQVTASDSTKTVGMGNQNCQTDSCCGAGQGKGLGKGKGHRHGKKDKFVDKDGDGINDNRCKGMGLCKGQKGRRCKKK